MEKVKENTPFLEALSRLHPKQAKALLKTAKSKQLDAICEIILNVVKQVLQVPQKLVKKAKRVKKVIRCLAKKTLSKKLRRKLMLKYIPIIRSILAAALPLVSIALTAAQF
jgi:hypothetical protein